MKLKRFAVLSVALGLATAGSSVLAEQKDQQVAKQDSKSQPVRMTEAQMDKVAGGALVNAVLVDVVDVNNNNVQVAVPVAASVAAGILGNAGAVTVQRPGRQIATQ